MYYYHALLFLVEICIQISSSSADRSSSMPSRQHFTCSARCYAAGNCNQELKGCECPLGRSGEHCEHDHIPACRSSNIDSIAYVGHWTVKNCDCWAQIAGVENMTSPALQDDERRLFLFRTSFEFDQNPLTPCFRSISGPQTSDIPSPLNGSAVQWFKGLGRQAKPISPPSEIKLDDWVFQLPLLSCKDRCNDKGACVKREPRSSPTCMCTRGFSGPSCMQPDPSGCVNYCGGNGACNEGFCHCSPGFWGSDCTRDIAYAPSALVAPSPALKIYRFELPWHAAFFHEADDLHQDYDQIYGAWEKFYEQFSMDTVRTQNIDEANLFYIPAFFYLKTSTPPLHSSATSFSS